MIPDLLRRYVHPTIRHALVAFSGWLIALNLPGLTDPTVTELSEIAFAALLLALAWAWSQVEKIWRRDRARAVFGATARHSLSFAAGALLPTAPVDPQALLIALLTWLGGWLWSLWEKRAGK